MSRLLWVGVGAAGGIYVYRKGERAWNNAKDRGVAGNAAVVASAASTMLSQVRTTMVAQQAAYDLARVPEPADVIDLRDSTRAKDRGRSGAIRLPGSARAGTTRYRNIS